jgi:uncharacterized phage-like protein YoqJ
MIVAFTGHRPDELGGYKDNPTQVCVKLAIREALQRHKPEKVISGMALGVDQWAAQAAIDLGIPFIAAVPFKGQETVWPEASQMEYQLLLAKAAQVFIVSEGAYAAWKMHKRNTFMVDNCDLLLAVWNGSDGGTADCVRYAENVKKPIERLKWELAPVPGMGIHPWEKP